MLTTINDLNFVDWSCSGGECEYVLVEDNPENRQALLDAGFTEQQLSEPEVKIDPGDDVLDVSYLAFNYAGADWFNTKTGFGTDPDSITAPNEHPC